MWKEVQPSREWLHSNVPKIIAETVSGSLQTLVSWDEWLISCLLLPDIIPETHVLLLYHETVSQFPSSSIETTVKNAGGSSAAAQFAAFMDVSSDDDSDASEAADKKTTEEGAVDAVDDSEDSDLDFSADFEQILKQKRRNAPVRRKPPQHQQDEQDPLDTHVSPTNHPLVS